MNYKDRWNLVKRGSEQGSSRCNDVMITSWLRRGQCTRTTEHTRICTTSLYVAIPTYILSENYSVQVLLVHYPSSTASALSSTTRDRKTPNGLSRKLYSPIQNASLHHDTPSTAIPHIPFSSSKFQASPHLEETRVLPGLLSDRSCQ